MRKINLFNKKATVNNATTNNTGLKFDRKSGVIKKATVSGFESFELPAIVVSEERTLDVDGNSIAFGIADRLVVGAYAGGKAYGHKGKEKSMKVETYEPIAVVAKLDDGLRIIVSRKFSKNAKKLEALVVYFNAYYLGNQVIRDEAINRVKIAEDLSYIENEETEAQLDEGVQYEQGKRMLAFVEAAAHSGATFTGLRVFGANIGGVANKIAKDENAKLLDIARKARADRKRDYKRLDAEAAEAAKLEELQEGLLTAEEMIEFEVAEEEFLKATTEQAQEVEKQPQVKQEPEKKNQTHQAPVEEEVEG